MEDNIELREIIELILKGKWLIIIISVLFLLISGIISWFVLEEKYESKAVLQISSGIQDTGIMSSYVAAEFEPNIYMQRLGNVEENNKFFKDKGFEDFSKENLGASIDSNSGLVNLTYQGNSPEEARELLFLLMSKTKNEMNKSVKVTLDQLENTYFNESKSLSTEIEQLMNKYNNIVVSNNLPEVLILQTISTSQFVLNLTEQQTSSLATISGVLQNELLQLKAQIDIKSNEYRSVLTRYQSVKTGLESFKADPFIRVIIEPTLSENPTSPNKLVNLAIGLVIGLIIGIFGVLFRGYWRKTAISVKKI